MLLHSNFVSYTEMKLFFFKTNNYYGGNLIFTTLYGPAVIVVVGVFVVAVVVVTDVALPAAALLPQQNCEAHSQLTDEANLSQLYLRSIYTRERSIRTKRYEF